MWSVICARSGDTCPRGMRWAHELPQGGIRTTSAWLLPAPCLSFGLADIRQTSRSSGPKSEADLTGKEAPAGRTAVAGGQHGCCLQVVKDAMWVCTMHPEPTQRSCKLPEDMGFARDFSGDALVDVASLWKQAE